MSISVKRTRNALIASAKRSFSFMLSMMRAVGRRGGLVLRRVSAWSLGGGERLQSRAQAARRRHRPRAQPVALKQNCALRDAEAVQESFDG